MCLIIDLTGAKHYIRCYNYIISFSVEMACSEVQTGHLTGLNCQIFTNQNARVTTDLSQRW